MEFDFDLIVIGSGPGGYVAAVRASKLGLKTAVIEKNEPGGVCLNIGCIPSKSLIHQAKIFSQVKDLQNMGLKVDKSGFDYKKIFEKSRQVTQQLSKGILALFKNNKVTYIKGKASLTGDAHTVEVEGKNYRSKFILLATGSSPRQLPGFEFDEKQVLSSTGILFLEELPKSLVILGSGAIGMEFAYIMNNFGVKVTVVEMLPYILPTEDRSTAEIVENSFRQKGIEFLCNTKALSLKKTNSGLEISIEKDGKPAVLSAEKLLVAAGRVPNTQNLGLEKLNIEEKKGYIIVRDYMLTSIPNIYAIGDIVPSAQLAHVASKEGEIAVDHMAGCKTIKRIDPLLTPAAVYCEPQIASFGYTEERAQKEGLAFKKALFPYLRIGKAIATDSSEGFAKILYNEETQEILGAHVVGSSASEIIHELILAKSAQLLLEDVGTMLHIHPTISEVIMEAARVAEN